MAAIEELRAGFAAGTFQYKKENEICRLSGVTGRTGRAELSALLKEMERAGDLVRDERGRFVTPDKLGLVRGKVQGNERGFAFLVREEGEDLFLPHRALHGALHGDEVFVRPTGGERGDEGEVYAVLRRGTKLLTGTYYPEKRGGIVEADERRFSQPVRIVGGLSAVAGEKVVVKVTAYPEDRMPEGEIVEVLGRSGELFAEEEAIIRSRQLRTEFPKKALAEAKRAASQPVLAEGRRDFRGDMVITIDGDDSRDFDDAVGLRKNGENFLLSVHIADVSHYVKRGGALDEEAYARGTSVYFPDRVLPMLPEELSNGACSLNEGEDRYTLSCLMELNGRGEVVRREICKGIIRSRARMTYAKVAAMLEGDRALLAEYADIAPMCAEMDRLARMLEEARTRRGGVDLDVREAHIICDEEKVEVAPRGRTAAHRLIEAFMILANEAVARFLEEKGLPCLFRVHEKPSEEKASAFAAYLRGLGLPVAFRPENVRPADYARVLAALEGDEKRTVVNRVMLRSMMKARYCEENFGHFGLASGCYCHFTSPIRRYPDLIVHRVLTAVLEGREDAAQKLASFVRSAGLRCSETERCAEEAEREVDELYKVWYMRGHIGERFEGAVSGVAGFGIFVELPNTVEGRIRIDCLPPDEYVFDEERVCLRGGRNSYSIGDPVAVVCVGCDVGARRVEFVPESELERLRGENLVAPANAKPAAKEKGRKGKKGAAQAKKAPAKRGGKGRRGKGAKPASSRAKGKHPAKRRKK